MLSAGVGNDGLTRFQRLCQPDVAANHAVVSYLCVTAEYGRSGIDDDIVAYVRVTLYSLYRSTGLCKSKALGPERHMLVYLHMLAYGGGLTYYDACSVIYEEVSSDRSARMYASEGKKSIKLYLGSNPRICEHRQ